MVPISGTKKVYAKFNDEFSRIVYENRILYSLTGDYGYIAKMLYSCFPKFGELVNVLQNRKTVIFGAGFWGKQLFQLLPENRVDCFCDSDEKKHSAVLFNRMIIPPGDLIGKSKDDLHVVIAMQNPGNANFVRDNLVSSGFPGERIFCLHELLFEGKQYFDKEIIKFDCAGATEVFINCGCYNFSDALEFIRCCNGSYKSIIAFEPHPVQFALCAESAKNAQRALVHPFALWHENTTLSFSGYGNSWGGRITAASENCYTVDAKMLDGILADEAATFITMDIEGAELNALKGAQNIIRKHKPKLAISIYHNPEDIFTIPEYLLSIHNDYKLYLRHYSPGSYDTVLYAV
jgi:FkbM family methyltransferase